jgi:heat shock protein HslJ
VYQEAETRRKNVNYPRHLSNRHFALAASLLILLALVTACGGPAADAPEENNGPTPLTEEALGNTEYRSEWPEGGAAQLTNGEYRKPIVEGSATELVIRLANVTFGDLDSDGVADAAVVLVTDPGGSGTFYDLAAILNRDGKPEHVATASLGDRAEIQALSVESGHVIIEMITHGPDDPMCCPTQLVRSTYALEDGALAEVASDVIKTAEGPGEPAADVSAELTLDALRNATYPSEWDESGTTTLTDGRYEGEPYVEGGATRLVVTLVEPIAFGDLDGDGVDDAAVILVASPGGSGAFYSLEAVRNEGGEPVHLASYSLGDRAQIESLAIEGEKIVLKMVTHGPDDPMCCPTQQVEQTYALQGNELVQTASQIVRSGAADDLDITGITWQWSGLVETAPAAQSVVPDPENYTLVFQPDGTVQIKADCNMVGGSYMLEDNILTIALGPSTMAFCGEQSLDLQYLELLGNVDSYILKEGRLALNLKAGAGHMSFTPGKGE